MGLFTKDIPLDDRISPAAMLSESSDARRIAKFQPALLQAIMPGEHLFFVSADIDMSSVMALTSQRIIYGSGPKIDYILAGNRVAKTTIRRREMPSGQRHKYCTEVTWNGGQLKHQSIRNFYESNDFLAIWRRDYDEVNSMCVLIDRAFGLQ
jgi:hypothetical protein